MNKTQIQSSHENHSYSSHRFHIYLFTDKIEIAENIGGLFRIADSFGVSKIYFYGANLDLKSRKIRKASRSCDHHVKFEDVDDVVYSLTQIKEAGYRLIALEKTNQSIDLEQLSILKNEKICLILGSEKYGVSSRVLGLCEEAVHIPMCGENSSMNVVVAGAIASYHLTKCLDPI